MKKLTAKQVISTIEDITKKYVDEEDGEGYDCLPWHFSSMGYGDNDKPGLEKMVQERLGEYEILSFGRATDDPEVTEVVVHFKKHNVNIGYFGYYSSWEGDNWNSAEPVEVTSEEITYTKWSPKK